MRRLLIAIVLVGAASTLALAPPTSRASFAANDHQDAKRVLSTETVTALSVQPNGKILAGGRGAGVGYTGDPAESGDFALALYQSNGRLDTSFGKGGRVLTDFGSSADWLRAVARQPDGKIVAAGFSTPFKSDVSSFALARYDSRGRLDPTFGRHGKVRVRFGPSGSAAYALALQPDGKIVAVGTSYDGPHPSWVVARFNSNGVLDRGFGDGGAVTTVFGAASEAGAVTLDPNGKIVVLGDSCEGEDPWTGCELALARYDVDGILDQTFGSGGKATAHFAGLDDVVGNGLAVQPDGKIVASGTAGISTDESDNYDFVLTRFDADGSLDSAFGTGGMVTSAFWHVYARGTYQNMCVFGAHYSYMQRGSYLFKLASQFNTHSLRDGVYDLVVTASDVRGNSDSQTLRFTVHNRGGWH